MVNFDASLGPTLGPFQWARVERVSQLSVTVRDGGIDVELVVAYVATSGREVLLRVRCRDVSSFTIGSVVGPDGFNFSDLALDDRSADGLELGRYRLSEEGPVGFSLSCNAIDVVPHGRVGVGRRGR